MRMFFVQDDSFKALYFNDEKSSLIVELFHIFILKIEYALENMLMIQSGYIAGQTFNYIAKNM